VLRPYSCSTTTKPGYPFAILESSIISAARTAASAALAAHWLSGQSHRAHSLGIVGTGFIARYVYEFLVDTGWTIEEVRLHDRSPLESEKFRNTTCRLEQHRTVTVVTDVAQLLRACDLILFTTVASTPHITDATLFEHNPVVLHISLRDLAPEILLRSKNVVDDVEHVMKANTSPHLAEQKTGNRSFVTGTLADIMIGRRSVNRSRPIIFSPFGMGILDPGGRQVGARPGGRRRPGAALVRLLLRDRAMSTWRRAQTATEG